MTDRPRRFYIHQRGGEAVSVRVSDVLASSIVDDIVRCSEGAPDRAALNQLASCLLDKIEGGWSNLGHISCRLSDLNVHLVWNHRTAFAWCEQWHINVTQSRVINKPKPTTLKDRARSVFTWPLERLMLLLITLHQRRRGDET